MPDTREDGSLSDAIAAQTIGDEASRFVLKPMQQVLEETLRGSAVPSVLHQYVQHDAMLINGAPQIVQHAPNADEHLVQVPGVSRLRPSSAQPRGELSAELQAPMPNAFVGHHDAALRQDQLDVAQTEAEDVIEPDGVADDLRRKPVSGIEGARSLRFHVGSLAHLPPKCQTRS
jgi:hypothetical protein